MQKLGKFEILGKLGQGAMAMVWKARDPFIDRLVALKTITTGLAEDPALLQRFYQEARSAGALQHPNIVTIFELGKEGDSPFIAMELLEGGSLDKLIESQPVMPLSQKLSYIVQVCRALEYAHSRQPNPVIHRDIKPANVMLTAEGLLKVADFGIARLGDTGKTQTGMLIGTLAYMSPQQIRGKAANAQSDIWAVGIMLYELIAGHRPFQGDNQAALMMNIIMQPTPPLQEAAPRTPPDLVTVVDKFLKKEAEERYHSMEEALLDLEPIFKRMQQSEVAELVADGQQLFDSKDFSKAQVIVERAVVIDTANTNAKNLLEKIRAEIRRTNLIPQAEVRIKRARELMIGGEFDNARAEAESALKLIGTFQPAREVIEEIKAAEARAQELNLAIRTTKQRLAEGAYTEAEVHLTKIFALDPNSPAGRELQKQIREEKERRERQRRLSDVMHKARTLWTDLRYDECIELLVGAQKEFPGDKEIAKLLDTARQDKAEQEKQKLLTEAREFLRAQNYDEALKKLDGVFAAAPGDVTAKNLQALALDGQRQAARETRFREGIAKLRSLVKDAQYAAAISEGRKLLAEFPNEPELPKLIEYAESEQLQAEKKARLEEIRQKAEQAFKGNRFREAIQAAESGLVEFPRNMDLMILLDKAKREQEEAERKEILAQRINDIRSRMKVGEITEAISRARETLITFGPDPAVSQALHQAEKEFEFREKKKREQEKVLEEAKTLVQSGDFSGATMMLQTAVENKLIEKADPRLGALETQIIGSKPLPQKEPPARPPAPPTGGSGAGSPSAPPSMPNLGPEYVYQQAPVLPDRLAPSDESATVMMSGAVPSGTVVQPVAPPVLPPPAPPKEKEKKKKPGKGAPQQQRPPAAEEISASATTIGQAAPYVPETIVGTRSVYNESATQVISPQAPAIPPRAPVAAEPSPASLPAPKPFWQQPIALGGIGAVLVVAIVAFVLMNRGSSKPGPDQPVATSTNIGNYGNTGPAPAANPANPANPGLGGNSPASVGKTPSTPNSKASGAAAPAKQPEFSPTPSAPAPSAPTPASSSPATPPKPAPVDYSPRITAIQNQIGQGNWDEAETNYRTLPSEVQLSNTNLKTLIDQGRQEDARFAAFPGQISAAAKDENRLRQLQSELNVYLGGRHAPQAKSSLDQVQKYLAALAPASAPAKAAPAPAPAPAAPVPAASAAASAPSDQDTIRKVFDGLTAGFAARNVNQIRQLWPSIPSKDADNLGKSFGATKAFSRVFAPSSINVSGDTAAVSGSYTGSVTISSPVPSNGSFHATMKKSGGQWAITDLKM